MAETRGAAGLQVFPKTAPGIVPESRESQETRDGSDPVRNDRNTPLTEPESESSPAWSPADPFDLTDRPEWITLRSVALPVAQEPDEDEPNHPVRVENVAQALFENLGGAGVPDDEILQYLGLRCDDAFSGYAWHALPEHVRAWWIEFVRDMVWCSRPADRQGTHVALIDLPEAAPNA